jgi:uncharacterized membrane protein
MLVVALSLVVLIGAVGLAVESGRFYLAKTELQNAADACALAAMQELGGLLDSDAFIRADQAGQLVALRHKVDFQGSAVQAGEVELAYAAALDGPWASAGSASGGTRHARCRIRRTGMKPWVMQVLGQGDLSIGAVAVAALVAPQIPVLAQ